VERGKLTDTNTTPRQERILLDTYSMSGVSTNSTKQHKHKKNVSKPPHCSDHSSRVGRMWDRRVPVLYASQVFSNVTGNRETCPDCNTVPVWDSSRHLICDCGKIWSEFTTTQDAPRPVDPEVKAKKTHDREFY
jgi:hypothetical protein